METKIIKINKVLYENAIGALDKFLKGVTIYEGNAVSFVMQYGNQELKIEVKVKD